MRTCLKSGVCKSRDNNEVTCVTRTNSKVRLRGGRDYSWIPPRLDSDVTNVGLFGKSIRQNVCYPLKELNESSQEKKILVNQPVEIGTRNVKKIKCVPIKLQKVMIPRNNIKPSYKFIQNSINSSSTLSMKKTVDIKVSC
ncbi:uncharacterized protein LOC143422963 [Xylocopa sonorina]|uniref:uncharacterized protein LOC143422963 n=1 Tax=Xylocopa sonorina TaxID=1818115 RepID=UPI00403AC5A1